MHHASEENAVTTYVETTEPEAEGWEGWQSGGEGDPMLLEPDQRGADSEE